MSGKSIVIAVDSHVARAWDVFEGILNGKVKESPDYFNPNTQLKSLVDIVNNDDSVAAVAFTGDNVDYTYHRLWTPARGNGERQTNWGLFNDITACLNVPRFILPGNHDYHVEPYNIRFHNPLSDFLQMKEQDLERQIIRSIVRTLGWSRYRGLRNELGTLFFITDPFAVADNIAQPLPHAAKVGDYDMLLLNTGNEAFVNPGYRKYLWKWFLDKKRINLLGLDDRSIQAAEEFLAGQSSTPAYLFMHAPLINSSDSRMGFSYHLDEDAFIRSREKNGLDKSVFVRGSRELLRAMAGSPRNITLVAGHTHSARYFIISKERLLATEVGEGELNLYRDDAEYIKQVVAPPLGGFSFDAKRASGYMAIDREGVHTFYMKQLPDAREIVELVPAQAHK